MKEGARDSDIIVFPENANFSKTLSGFLNPASAQKFFNNLSRKDVLIVDSNRIESGRRVRSRALLINSKEGVVDFYDKKLLTPGGESLPYIAAAPLYLFEHLFSNDFVSSGAVYEGGLKDNILTDKDTRMGLLTCSDIISPNISRENKIGLIINNNNLGVFDGNHQIAKQLLSMARYRAAENGKYAVISSNFGLSYIIDFFGNIVKSTSSPGYEILTGEIVLNQQRTWYNRLGDWPILLVSLLIFGLGIKKLS